MMRRILIAGFVLYFGAVAGLLTLINHVRARGSEGPVQPIAFSHQIHAGQLGLECTYCHQTAETSARPGIPSIERCMECHESAATDRPEIQILRRHWEMGEPIVWERVYELPWHVTFTHKRHVRAGIDCATCHGEVRAQARVRQVRSLKMGWCVNCHRAHGAETDCLTCHR